jgi:hypothetical protein
MIAEEFEIRVARAEDAEALRGLIEGLFGGAD